MCTVGSAKGISVLAVDFVLHGLQIAFGQHHVRIERDEVFALGVLGAVVAAQPRTAVFLGQIVDVECALVALAYILAGACAAVFHDDDFKVLHREASHAVQQFVHLFWAVENGDDK